MKDRDLEEQLRSLDFDKIFIEENPFWSQTSLKSIDVCPKQYFIYSILRLKRDVGAEIIRGQILHDLIEKFWKVENNVYLPIPMYKDEKAFSGVVRSRLAYIRKEAYEKGKIKEGYVNKETLNVLWSKKFIEETEEMARLIYRTYVKDDEIKRVSTGKRKAEISLEGKVIFEGEEIKYKTIIDELLPPLILRDHKTGYLELKKEFLDNDLQFSFYSFALWNEFQKESSPLRSYYGEYFGIGLDEFLRNIEIQIHHIPPVLRMKEKGLSENEIPKESVIIKTKRDSKQIYDLFKTILAKRKLLLDRNFHPTTDTSVCSFKCNYRRICPYIDTEEILRKLESKDTLFQWAGISCESNYNEKKIKQKSLQKQISMRLIKSKNEFRI